MELNNNTVKVFLVVLAGMLLGFSNSYAQDSDLEALEGMAETLHLERAKEDVIEGAIEDARDADVEVKVQTPDVLQPSDAGSSQQKPASTEMTQEGFSELLKKKYLGSYIFYTKLSNEEKQQVLDEYLSTQDMVAVRKKISSLLSK